LKTPEGKTIFGRFNVDGRIILKWLIKTWDGGVDWIDPTQDRDKVTLFFENGYDPSVSIKCGEFLDYLRIC